jgi:DNA-binding PadR family transcriptional regulator
MSEDLGRWSDPSMLVLASLAAGPKHGYAITQDIAAEVGVQMGPGTLYGAITRLEERGFIEALPAEQRRRPYQITAAGAAELEHSARKMRAVAELGLTRLAGGPVTA